MQALIERDEFISLLRKGFNAVKENEGRCVLVSGEAGIGKTSLVREFCRTEKSNAHVFQGLCDAMFTPRPLAPLFDILLQMKGNLDAGSPSVSDRSILFSSFFNELLNLPKTTILVIEDIHWADEATLDLIKFIARRIDQLKCLFICTYRDNEIHSNHPLRNVLGQLSPDFVTRIQLPPLSRQAVDTLSSERGYSGEDVYGISGGNPFYVNEILASYSPGIPANIKDSILAVYHSLDVSTRDVWQLISVIPTSFETNYLEKFDPFYADAIANCHEKKILITENGMISFKHELYRRTVENALSPLLRINLNKKILELLLETFEQTQELERIIHHAKNANDCELVVKWAPIAAGQAAKVGAHIESSRLYSSAIEYYQGNDRNVLAPLYEAYAYECYLTNQMKEAIIYTTRALSIWKEKNDLERTGASLRFLSRLWWFEGNHSNAMHFAEETINVLKDRPGEALAMSYSNMSQLKMLSDENKDAIYWGEKAITLAKEFNNNEILSHALNNVGASLTRIDTEIPKGRKILQESLDIALQNGYQEHVARAYANLGFNLWRTKEYKWAADVLESGFLYCDERDLSSWAKYIRSTLAQLKLEMGQWDDAVNYARAIVSNDMNSPVIMIGSLLALGTIKMRRGEKDALPLLLRAKKMAFDAMELQRLIPSMVAIFEVEWITGQRLIEKSDIEAVKDLIQTRGNKYDTSKFAFWLFKSREQKIVQTEIFEGYTMNNPKTAKQAALFWEKCGCPYEQALALFECSDTDKKNALTILQQLGATVIFEKLKMEMRSSGIRNVPRGWRKTTQTNPAHLTDREIDVLELLKEGLQNKEIAAKLFISVKTVDHHISSILFKLDVNSRVKAVQEAGQMGILK